MWRVVWAGNGEGPGNAALAQQGARVVSTIEEFFDAELGPAPAASPSQGSLFT